MGGKRRNKPDSASGKKPTRTDVPGPEPEPNENDAVQLGGPARRTADAGKILIVHDEKGNIVTVTRPTPGARSGVSIELQPGHAVIELEGTSVSERLSDLHDHYVVDVEDGTLAKKRVEP